MHSENPRQSRRAPSNLERFWISVALTVVSLLWITEDLAWWATALCAVGALTGTSTALCTGRRHVLSRSRRGR